MVQKSTQIKFSVYHASHVRLDRYISDLMGLARNIVKDKIQSGDVIWNGCKAKPSQKVAHQDEIEVHLSVHTELVPILASIQDGVLHSDQWEIPILYSDDELMVVNKPAGLVVHAAPTIQDANLVDIVLSSGVSLSPGEKAAPGLFIGWTNLQRV